LCKHWPLGRFPSAPKGPFLPRLAGGRVHHPLSLSLFLVFSFNFLAFYNHKKEKRHAVWLKIQSTRFFNLSSLPKSHNESCHCFFIFSRHNYSIIIEKAISSNKNLKILLVVVTSWEGDPNWDRKKKKK